MAVSAYTQQMIASLLVWFFLSFVIWWYHSVVRVPAGYLLCVRRRSLRHRIFGRKIPEPLDPRTYYRVLRYGWHFSPAWPLGWFGGRGGSFVRRNGDILMIRSEGKQNPEFNCERKTGDAYRCAFVGITKNDQSLLVGSIRITYEIEDPALYFRLMDRMEMEERLALLLRGGSDDDGGDEEGETFSFEQVWLAQKFLPNRVFQRALSEWVLNDVVTPPLKAPLSDHIMSAYRKRLQQEFGIQLKTLTMKDAFRVRHWIE